MSGTEYEAAKGRLDKRLRRIVAEYQQIIVDIEWWNEHRTDAPPFDVGNDRLCLRAARHALACLRSDDRDGFNKYWAELISLRAQRRYEVEPSPPTA